MGARPQRCGSKLPFAHLNLRHNPFGEPERAERAALALVTVPRLERGSVVQFIGAEGRGKTTHLLALTRLHPDATYEYLPEGARRFVTSVGSTPLLLLDEAQRLCRRERRRLFRSFPCLAVATHEDLSRSAGVPVQTLRVGGIDVERLARILDRRLEWARRGPGPLPRFGCDACSRLIERFGDNLRAIEDYLYEVFQRLREPCDVEV